MARPAQLLVIVIPVALLVSAPAVNAVTCGQVVNMMSPCIGYVMGRDPTTSPSCCNGLRSVNDAARTTSDRQTTCNCLKQQMSGMVGLKPNLVATIHEKCGIHVHHPINPSTDCSKVY